MKLIGINLLLLLLVCNHACGYRILVLTPFPVYSHCLWLNHFLEELLNRGHELTIITNYKSKELHPNSTEILIEPMFDIPAKFPKSELFKMKYGRMIDNLYLYINVGYLTTAHALESKNVKQFIEQDNQKFDLILSEQFYQEAFLMFAHKYKVPIVTIGTIGYSDFMDRAMGALTPWSIVPHTVLDYTDNMSFYERIYNIIVSFTDTYLRYFEYYPKQEALAKKHFSSFEKKYGPLPSVKEFEKQISVMLINSHIATSRPRPLMPGMISVAGAHIHSPKKLPADIEQFLDNSTEGVIFFSLGTYVKSQELPPEKLQIFFDVFRSLKVKVLWKFEDETIKNVPKNVMIKKWIPQSDVLAHPNIILFITHGGMFGTQEAIHRGVPMLFIPFYGDQFRNAEKSMKNGYGLTIRFVDLTSDTLNYKINEMISNKKYTENMKRASAIFCDNPIKPLDEAMFWIEYVARHKGAPHLKSAGVNLPWYSYLSLDIFGLFLTILLIILTVIYKLLKLFCLIFSSTNKSKEKKN